MLGAGLGTRLRPLTEWLPKPMVPVYHRPLVAYAFDHLSALGVKQFIVNTHHFPQAYTDAFPGQVYRDTPVAFRHEPVLLETAGGIANVADLLGDETFLVYNGDILSDVPLQPLLEAHQRDGNEVTLLLRRAGPGLHIGLAQGSSRLQDIRGKLGRPVDAWYQFSGIYVVEPAFLERLTPGKKESVIPIFLNMIEAGAGLSGCVVDEGYWWDLGDELTYRQVHQAMVETQFPAYSEESKWVMRDPRSKISPQAHLSDGVIVGPGAVIEAGAQLEDVIIWPGARVAAGERIQQSVVRPADYESFIASLIF